MKTTLNSPLMVIVALTIVSGCKKKPIDQISEKADASKPKVEVRVDKRYDDKGNLIEFDSLYSSYYSHLPRNKYMMDTLFNSFHQSFLESRPGVMDEHINSLFFRDTLYSDFFHEDFFMRRYEMNDLYMRRMMHDLDSIKNHHFKELSEKHPMFIPKK